MAVIDIDKTFKLEIHSCPTCKNTIIGQGLLCEGSLVPIVHRAGEVLDMIWKCSVCGKETFLEKGDK